MNLWSSLLIVIKSCYMWRFHKTGFKIPWCFPLNEGTTTVTSWIWLTNHSQRKWSCANYRSQTIWNTMMNILSLRKSPKSTWGGSWLWLMPSINCQLWEKKLTLNVDVLLIMTMSHGIQQEKCVELKGLGILSHKFGDSSSNCKK